MNPQPQDPLGSDLLAQVEWVRRLARQLVAQPDRAEDLAQDTMVAALEAPRSARSLRPWLAGTARLLARQSARGEGRRRAREEQTRADQSGRAACGPEASELLQRAETQRALMDALLALEEPYRETLLLRFLEDLPPRKIAARQNVTVAAVKSRIQRGLERLRQRLDGKYGGPEAWMAAILPLCAPPAGVAPVTVVLTTMSTSSQVILAGAAAAFLAILGWQFWPEQEAHDPQPSQAAAIAPAQQEPAAADPDRVEPGALTRQAAPQSPAADAAAPAAAARMLEGRVVDTAGLPIAGARILARKFGSGALREAEGAADAARAALATADDAGRFALPAPAVEIVLEAERERYLTVLNCSVGPDTPRNLLLVMAPAVRLAGEVVDPLGAPVAGARVSVALPEGFRARFGSVLDDADVTLPAAVTDARGAFDLPAAPAADASLLQVEAANFAPWSAPAPQSDALGLRVVLAAAPGGGSVAGVVLDPQGAAVPGAMVTLGPAAMRTDEEGAFRLDVPPNAESATPLRAVAPGYQAVTLHPERGAGGAPVWPDRVILRLEAPALTIRGRVVNEAGAGLAGVQVWATDTSFLAHEDELPATLEGVSAGAPTMSEIQNLAAAQPSRDAAHAFFQNTPSISWPFARTGADGGFELRGLQDREYRLRALDTVTLGTATAAAAAGAVEVKLVMHESRRIPVVAGVVVSESGDPLPGVTIRLMTDTLSLSEGPGSMMTMHAAAEASARTDEAGQFRLEKVAAELTYLRLEGESVVPREYGRGAAGGIAGAGAGPPEALRLVVSERTYFRVDLADPDFADSIRVLDADGQPVTLNLITARGRTTSETFELHEGKSETLSAPALAAEILFLKSGREVGRRPLKMLRGEVVVVRG